MTTSDARKRNAEAAQDPDAFTREWLRWVDESQRYTPAHPLHLPRFTQEPDMTAKTRHDELKALLSKISEESVTTSNVLADMLDLLRERLPESPNHTSGGPYTCMGCGTELYAGDPLDCGKHGEPAPADNLPGEPVEPGDLRAGDRVEFAWEKTGEDIACTLVNFHDGSALYSDVPDSGGYRPNVVWNGVWCHGISDVRLIERAPREDDDPDEALARVMCSAFWGGQVMPSADNADWKNVARAAREHIEAEEVENHPVGCGQMIRDVRDGDGFVTTIDGVMIAKTDSWDDLTERAEKAEAEAKLLRERLDDRLNRDRRIHEASCGESPARTKEQAGRDYGVTTGLRQAVRHLDERAAAIEAGGPNA